MSSAASFLLRLRSTSDPVLLSRVNEQLALLALETGEGAFYEDWRQETLISALGQVHCSVSEIPLLSGGLHQWPMDKPCAHCGAAL